MAKKTKASNFITISLVYLFLALVFLYSVYQLAISHPVPALKSSNFIQPKLISESPWPIKSIDTQIVSKHWTNVPVESVNAQIEMLKKLGVNYIAVDTFYDDEKEMYKWANAIHDQKLHVWFRSHWKNWEGDEGLPASMTPQEYLDKTKSFISHNPKLFVSGDSFTLAIEPEQAGVGLGKKFLDWNQYRQFILNELVYSNEAFQSIYLGNQIHTNWISVNGWVANNAFTQELADKLELITVDHFSVQTSTIGANDDPNKVAEDMSRALDEIYNKWKMPVLLGEWGYQIYQDTDPDIQAEVIKKVLGKIKTKNYLIGVNYWSHMGNHARIIDDQSGSSLNFRPGAFEIAKVFKNTDDLSLTSSLSATPLPILKKVAR